MTIDVAAVGERWAAYRAMSAPSRVKSLSSAIADNVEAGDLIFLGGTMARPNAAMFEIMRQFAGKAPDFTLAAPAVANQHAPVLQSGIFRHVITSIHGATFPTPGPHPIYQALSESGKVTFENWTLLTLVQRLMAGALGLPFMPTGSIAGTDLARDLERTGKYMVVNDPETNASQPVVAALRPDVTILHAPAADEAGNVVVCPPYYDSNWAALAADRAVIVTVEKILPPETIRRYAHLVQIPAERVTAVCPVPFGSHPSACPASVIPEVAGYPEDYDFLEHLLVVGRDPDRLKAWSEEWISTPKTHQDYLEKLGPDRLHALRGRASDDGWRFDLPAATQPPTNAISRQERHLALASRVLQRKLRTGEIDMILAGLGISSLAAWVAALRLREQGIVIPLMVEAGMYGFVPSPADPFLFNYRNMLDNVMLSDVLTILGAMVGGPGNRAIGVLGAAEIDGQGNINTTKLPDLLLTGSGGGNDIASGARQVMVTIPHGTTRLVEQVHYITSPGRAVQTIVTDRAVLERHGAGFLLTAVLDDGTGDLAALIHKAIEECGFPLSVDAECTLEPMPDNSEASLARLLDPHRRFIG